MNVLRTLLLWSVISCAIPQLVLAQTLCSFWDSSPTFRERLDNSEILVAGKVVCTYPANPEAKFSGMTVFAIQKVEKDKSESFVKEQLVTVPYHLDLSKEKTFRIPGNFDDQGTFSWGIDSSKKLSPQVFQYLIESPKQTKSEMERLGYYFQFLEHPDEQIALDAAVEFHNMPWKHLISFSKTVDRELLRKRMKNAREQREFDGICGLYATMLGRCGNKQDAEFLKSIILEESDSTRFGIRSIMHGYLLLTGDKGLDVIDEHILQNRDAPWSETFGAVRALEFMWYYGDNRISPDRLRQSMRIVLDNHTLADLAIRDLAQWNDWSVMDRLMEIYDDEEYQAASPQRLIIHYLLIAKKSEALTQDGELPEHVKKATSYLNKLRQEDPKTVQRAKRYFFD